MTRREKIGANVIGTDSAVTSARSCYRDQAVNWIALGVLLTAWQLEAQLDRDEDSPTDPRLSAAKPMQASLEEPLWATGPRARSWISRAAARSVRTR